MSAAEDRKQILIIDRDVVAVEPLRQRLTAAGFAVRTVADGIAALTTVSTQPPHLTILDWNAPQFPAFELIRTLRRTQVPHEVRLIILSALASEQDVVAGLELGADDYIAKPFSIAEVLSRVNALLRSQRSAATPARVTCGELELDPAQHRISVRGHLLPARRSDVRLLEFLVSHPGLTFDRRQLLVAVWGEQSGVDARTVDVNVQRLRKMLAQFGLADNLQTVRGFGYRFLCPPAAL